MDLPYHHTLLTSLHRAARVMHFNNTHHSWVLRAPRYLIPGTCSHIPSRSLLTSEHIIMSVTYLHSIFLLHCSVFLPGTNTQHISFSVFLILLHTHIYTHTQKEHNRSSLRAGACFISWLCPQHLQLLERRCP